MIIAMSKVMSDYIFNQIFYFFTFKIFFNLNNPKSFNEKIQRRKIENNNNIFSELSDKIKVRNYVAQKSDINLIELYGTFDCFGDIDFCNLPNSFVMKTNHDSGSVIIVRNKSKIQKDNAKKILNNSLSFDYGKFSKQHHYSKIERKILIEELLVDLNGKIPSDIKVHCFHGEPKFIQIASNDHKSNDIYDLAWNKLDVDYLNKRSSTIHDKPLRFLDILKVSKDLADGFDYVRVDMYLVNDILYFGELTFTPNNGFAKIVPDSFDKELGNLW